MGRKAEAIRTALCPRFFSPCAVEVLEDLLLSFRLPVFTRRAKRHTASHPKFYLFDSGVFRSPRPKGPLDIPEGIESAALEGLVAQHLHAWLAYSEREDTLFYWRTRGGAEVDFVIYGEIGFWAIEVKNTARIRPEDLRGLKSFMADYPESEGLLLYRGQERLMVENIRCIPVGDFLRHLHPASGITRF